MSRHSRTSTASSVLNLCRNTEKPLGKDDLGIIRDMIMNNPNVSEDSKSKIIDLVSIVVFKHEEFRNAFCALEDALAELEDSDGDEVVKTD